MFAHARSATVLDGGIRQLLQVKVKSGVDDDPALLHRGCAKRRLERRKHVVDEMRSLALPRGRLDLHLGLDVLFGGLVGL